ncbi:MAG: hypothetical protein KAI06_00315 [Anaerolineales bacterium]|nr:hypothetical protein [Anaerolineales bacterium]
MTIRLYDWRDLILLHRIRNSGMCLDAKLMYTRGAHTLRHTPLGTLIPGPNVCTLVSRADYSGELSAAGQFLIRNSQLPARLVFISPREILSKPEGISLLEAMAHMAGERGAHALIAEIDERDPAFDGLHAAGFAIYSRQRILRLARIVEDEPAPHEETWRPAIDRDYIAIQSLYTNLVPALVQQVESPPSRAGRGLVYWSQGELLGYMDVEHGPQGVWVQPYFHPAAELGDELLTGIVLSLSPSQKRPLFICVRSYQGGLSQSLNRLGFETCSSQAVMVKRLAAPIRRQVRAEIPALDGTQPEPSAPFASIVQRKPTSKHTYSL